METAVRQISNADGSIYLFDLYNDDGSFQYKPCLVFNEAKSESCWDNEEYVLNFFIRLKKNKEEQNKELKLFCEEQRFNFEHVKQDLLDIFKTSKKLNFWEEK
jgi:hypothetical protein